MYGLVNKAIKDLVVSRFGEDTWREIRTRAGVPVDSFVSMTQYSDTVTYDLVGAASEILGAPAADILESFGKYWTVYTAQQGYGEYLRHSGSSLVEFLNNLDNLHARVELSFDELRPPSFRVTDATDEGLRLHYHSEREGLAPLVKGLLHGLGELFDTPIEVHHDRARGDGCDHDEFVVRYLDPGRG